MEILLLCVQCFPRMIGHSWDTYTHQHTICHLKFPSHASCNALERTNIYCIFAGASVEAQLAWISSYLPLVFNVSIATNTPQAQAQELSHRKSNLVNDKTAKVVLPRFGRRASWQRDRQGAVLDAAGGDARRVPGRSGGVCRLCAHERPQPAAL